MDDKIQKKINALFDSYRKNLPIKIKSIEKLWHDLLQHWDTVQFQTLHRDVHSLCGSAGTYGYCELGKSARQMEIFLKSLMVYDEISLEARKKITDYLVTLKTVFETENPKMPSLFEKDAEDEIPEDKYIYIMEHDQRLVDELTDSLKHSAYNPHQIQDLITLQLAVQEKPPIALIINTAYLDKAGVEFLLEIQKKQLSPIPLFCIVPNEDLIPRLQAIRAGCDAFFQKTVDISHITQMLNHKFSTSTGDPYRILIIDDSESLAEYYSLILNQAGMIAHAITNPLTLLDELESFQPDLLLMDIYMPECTGLELASVLRQEINYTKIPIIFLSTEEDKNKKLFAISLGGDDFLTKPIPPQHLISAVRSRSKRASILNYYMKTDGLTGLLNHSSILKQLNIELIRAKQNKTPLTFIMIDIDHFKNVNDTYGHPIGNMVIKKLAELFLTRLRSNDTVGRYGGEEFALILPGTTVIDSKKICNGLRVKFSEHLFNTDKNEFFVTFSAGITCFDGINDATTIILEADKALYKAKQLGRNQICVFEKE